MAKVHWSGQLMFAKLARKVRSGVTACNRTGKRVDDLRHVDCVTCLRLAKWTKCPECREPCPLESIQEDEGVVMCAECHEASRNDAAVDDSYGEEQFE